MTRLRNLYDQVGKVFVEGAFEGAARIETEHEIPGVPRSIDIWLERIEGPAPPGIFGRMLADRFAIELFSGAPPVDVVAGCMIKQLSTALAVWRADPQASIPPMWLVCAGRPTSVIDGLSLAHPDEWPIGFYRLVARDVSFYVVVVSELPVVRETLMLRLLGRGHVLETAIRELAALPEDAWELHSAANGIRVLRSAQPEDKVEEAIIMSAKETYEQIKREGRQEGLQEGRAATLLELLRLRFGSLEPAAVQRIEEASVEVLERLTQRVLTAATLREALDDA